MSFRIALCQMNSTVGDLRGNTLKIMGGIRQAKAMGADLVAFPELAMTGYPPEDLLLKPQFVQDNLTCLNEVVGKCRGITAVVGFVDQRAEGRYNAAAIIHGGRTRLIYHKQCLPNYGVFDEARYFRAGTERPVFMLKGVVIGVNICEDIWLPEGPTQTQTEMGGAALIVNISASPYHAGKGRYRQTLLAGRARRHRALIAYVNQVGGQDELVFDGESLILDERGTLQARGTPFKEALIVADLDMDGVTRVRHHTMQRRVLRPAWTLQDKRPHLQRMPVRPAIPNRLSRQEEIYRALLLGLSDYVRKNGFQTCVIGLSGGIDSALTAVVAADALGKEQVVGVFMPSRYTAAVSHEDAKRLAKNLGIRLMTFSIEAPFQSHLTLLAGVALPSDTTTENLQSRIRGNILMALSNRFGWLVITTGNKSEMSVGYATLYGDMAGGFSVLKDLWKTEVYRLARWRNRKDRPIPARTFSRSPTAELRENQTDQDTLPPYPILDPILRAYIEEDKGYDEIVRSGATPETASAMISMVDRAEFKRRQAPLGIKITPRAFGKDRRMPVTHRYRAGCEPIASPTNQEEI